MRPDQKLSRRFRSKHGRASMHCGARDSRLTSIFGNQKRDALAPLFCCRCGGSGRVTAPCNTFSRNVKLIFARTFCTFNRETIAEMVELADTLALGASAVRHWGFESPSRHYK